MSVREQQLRARLRRHRLDRPARCVDDLADSLLCGFQDAGPGTGSASLALRLGPAVEASDLVTSMTLRGVPHTHRAGDLGALRSAMSATARADLEAVAGDLAAEVAAHDDPVGEVAVAITTAIDGGDEPTSKSDLSTAVTPLLPPELAPYCPPCAVHHTIDGLFRLATLRAWLVLVPGTATQTFLRLPGSRSASRPRPGAVESARSAVAAAALRLSAPSDVEQTATWLGWPRSAVQGRSGRSSGPRTVRPPQRRARLLPARDPWLRGTDRAWLLGDHLDHRSEVFRSLGAPGVVLLDGEIVGSWRQRKAGQRLAMAVELWQEVGADLRDELEVDAQLVADVRDLRPALSLV